MIYGSMCIDYVMFDLQSKRYFIGYAEIHTFSGQAVLHHLWRLFSQVCLEENGRKNQDLKVISNKSLRGKQIELVNN